MPGRGGSDTQPTRGIRAGCPGGSGSTGNAGEARLPKPRSLEVDGRGRGSSRTAQPGAAIGATTHPRLPGKSRRPTECATEQGRLPVPPADTVTLEPSKIRERRRREPVAGANRRALPTQARDSVSHARRLLSSGVSIPRGLDQPRPPWFREEFLFRETGSSESLSRRSLSSCVGPMPSNAQASATRTSPAFTFRITCQRQRACGEPSSCAATSGPTG